MAVKMRLRTDEGARTPIYYYESPYEVSRERALSLAIWVGMAVLAFAFLMFIILTPW